MYREGDTNVSSDQHVYSERLASVHERIVSACSSAGRSSDDTTLIVVSKFHPQEVVRSLYALGVRDFGENRHQEAQPKAVETADLDIHWHFVGQLQSNKARQAAKYASSIHSIDRPAIVDSLAKLDHTIDAFIQINLTEDVGRGGVEPQHLDDLVERVLKTDTLKLRGIMGVAPLDGDEEEAFERIANFSLRVQQLAPEATSISAGMTHDFETAIQYGATHLRIGSAITGDREY